MKALKSCMGVVGVLLLIGFLTTNAKASEYLGEFCWNVVIDGETQGTAKLGVTHMGGNHYFIQGGASEANIYCSGSGLIVGNKIVFSMSGTQTHTGRPIKSGNSWDVTIDLATMNGQFWCVSTEYLEDGSSNIHYDEGTWEFTSCQ